MNKYWSYFYSKFVWSPGMDKIMNKINKIKLIITSDVDELDNFYYMKPYETRGNANKKSAKS
jgi:hypothetical protein